MQKYLILLVLKSTAVFAALFAAAVSTADTATPQFSTPSICSRYLVSRMLYRPEIAEQRSPLAAFITPADAKEFSIENLPFGVRVSGIEKIDSQTKSPVVIFLYGNAMNMASVLPSPLMPYLSGPGRDYALFDFPGYGKSTGELSERGMVTATMAVIDRIRKSFPQKPIVLWGWSLGSAVAIQAAAQRSESVDRLILSSTWSSLGEVAKTSFPKIPSFIRNYIIRGNQYDSIKAARAVKADVLMLHGEKDQMFPTSMAKDVFDHLGSSRKIFRTMDADHVLYSDLSPVHDTLDAFITGVNLTFE